jgi:hypothetical protein
MKRICETCNAFQPGEGKSPSGEVMGECRARSAQLLANYSTPQGGAWQCGWPTTGANGWCREWIAKPAPLRAVEATNV